MYTETGDQDEERGVHAIFLVVVCVLMWRFLVCIWPSWQGPFCCCKQLFVEYVYGKLWLLNKIYGGVALQIPNGFGFGLGTVQLILYAIYCEKKGFTRKSNLDESNGKSHQEEKQSSKSRLEQVQDMIASNSS